MLKVGDRIRIKQSEIEHHLQPQRKWGREGRCATIILLWNEHGFMKGSAKVRFDSYRKSNPNAFECNLRLSDIEKLDSA